MALHDNHFQHETDFKKWTFDDCLLIISELIESTTCHICVVWQKLLYPKLLPLLLKINCSEYSRYLASESLEYVSLCHAMYIWKELFLFMVSCIHELTASVAGANLNWIAFNLLSRL